MRAILCTAFKGIEALGFAEVDEPRPAANEVLIDVHAASVGYMDYLMSCGGYQMRPALPYVPGTDAAGIVLACGDRVTRFRPGDRVSCGNWLGAFAERMVAKEGSFSRAAERLYRTQPAISLAIRKLEDSLGQPLFVRGARPVPVHSVFTRLAEHSGRKLAIVPRSRWPLLRTRLRSRRQWRWAVRGSHGSAQ